MTSVPALLPALTTSRSAFRWAHHSTIDFPGAATPDMETLCILPVYSYGDHGLGLPLKLEEVVGSAVLDRALDYLPAPQSVRVLPPLVFGLVPYGPKIGALDPETMHEVLSEVSQSVKAAGYRKLVFWVGSPWNSELVDTASRDARIEMGMQTFVVEFDGVGLPLHPACEDRSSIQAMGSRLLETTPEAPPVTAAQSLSFDKSRPGNWAKSRPQAFDPSVDAAALLENSARRFASLLSEMIARAPLGEMNHRALVPLVEPPNPRVMATGSTAGEKRYLPGLDAAALNQLEHKESGLVIIPVGAIEQHGPHLPVVVDTLLAQAAVVGMSERLPPDAPVWFGPQITFGKSNEHRTFPGTISISAKSLRRLIIALATQLKALGFRHIALLNTHGGNSSVIDYTLREIQTDLDLRVTHLRIPSTAELSPQENTWGFHAGEWETSLMLALAPELVDQSRAICHYPARLTDPGQLRPESASAIFSWQSSDIAPDGVMGDATAATTEKGERWFPEAMQRLADQVVASLS